MKQRDIVTPQGRTEHNIDEFYKYVRRGPDTYSKEWVCWLLNELGAANQRGAAIYVDNILAGRTMSGNKEPRP